MKNDIIIIGSKIKQEDYVGSRTENLYSLFKKYLPNAKLSIYDVYEDDSKRIEKESARNYIFLPWINTIDIGWIGFFDSLPEASKKILYTDEYYWTTEINKKFKKNGYNLENIFNTIAFVNTEGSPHWQNDPLYKYWGYVLCENVYKNISEINNEKYIFVDELWNFDISPEPYNAKRILNEYMPKFKEKHSEYKIVSQNNNEKWVDINLPKMPFKDILKYYYSSAVYIVSHRELFGGAQMDARMVGTKILTNKNFSLNSSLLSDRNTYGIWEWEENNFMETLEKCLVEYDKNEVIKNMKQSYSEEDAFERIKDSLFGID